MTLFMCILGFILIIGGIVTLVMCLRTAESSVPSSCGHRHLLQYCSDLWRETLCVHSPKTCWSESINTLVAFVTLLSADYVSENCWIIKEVVVAGSCCTCSKPSSQSVVTCSWTCTYVVTIAPNWSSKVRQKNLQIFTPAKKFQALHFDQIVVTQFVASSNKTK